MEGEEASRYSRWQWRLYGVLRLRLVLNDGRCSSARSSMYCPVFIIQYFHFERKNKTLICKPCCMKRFTLDALWVCCVLCVYAYSTQYYIDFFLIKNSTAENPCFRKCGNEARSSLQYIPKVSLGLHE